ncbi:MAG: glycine betaine ABC transporter substrate-binding protein [Rubrobacteraceae bacterium]
MNGKFSRKEMLKLSGAALAGASLMGVAGCGSGGSEGDGSDSSSDNSNKTLTLGDIGWTESIAVSNLTKVLFEEDLGYRSVDLKTLDVSLLFKGVGGGDLAAFQDVWMPNHRSLLNNVKDQVEHLDPWFEGKTSFGLAVPSYMEVTSLADLNDSPAEVIIGIEPGTPMVKKVNNSVIPAYDLKIEQKASSTAGMLSEMERRYPEESPFVFMPWCPHWMCNEYDFRFLDDPKDAQGDLNDPASISTIVNKNLPEDDPTAYAFMKAFTMNEEELNSLENEIRKEGDDAVAGATVWLESNRDVVKPWLEAANNA